MNINYEIRETAECGKGLYARELIKKGTCVWSYRLNENVYEYDEHQSRAHLQSLPSLKAQQRFLDSSFGKGNVLCLIVDDGQYVNHAEECNCKTDPVTGHCYALQDILAGEEILEDYRSFTHPPFLFALLKQYECEPEYYALPPRII